MSSLDLAKTTNEFHRRNFSKSMAHTAQSVSLAGFRPGSGLQCTTLAQLVRDGLKLTGLVEIIGTLVSVKRSQDEPGFKMLVHDHQNENKCEMTSWDVECMPHPGTEVRVIGEWRDQAFQVYHWASVGNAEKAAIAVLAQMKEW